MITYRHEHLQRTLTGLHLIDECLASPLTPKKVDRIIEIYDQITPHVQKVELARIAKATTFQEGVERANNSFLSRTN